MWKRVSHRRVPESPGRVQKLAPNDVNVGILWKRSRHIGEMSGTANM